MLSAPVRDDGTGAVRPSKERKRTYMTHAKAFSATVLVVGLLASSLAAAADGMVNSISFTALPSPVSSEVRAFDDSDADLALKTEFEAALTSAGYTVRDGGKLVFSFETRDEIGAWSTTDRRHILSFESRGGQGGNENNKARINVYDSQSGGLINKGSGGTSIATPSSYRIEAFLEDRASGKTLWQAWAIADLRQPDGASLTRKMVPAIIQSVGKTVRQKTFSLY